MCPHSPRALSKRESDGCFPVYRVLANKTEKETNSEICVEGDARMGAQSGVSLEMLKTAAEFLLGPMLDRELLKNHILKARNPLDSAITYYSGLQHCRK
jgi:hypothetical protein